MPPPAPGYKAQLSHTTVFLRNLPQLEELAGVLLPRVWPAGATRLDALVYGGSIGCEAFSLLIALHEFGPDSGRIGARVLSVDAVETVTVRGQAGLFPAETFAPLYEMEGGMSDALRARWFQPAADGVSWRPLPELRAATEFQTLDLLAQPLPRTFDLLVCQNVLTHLEPLGAAALLDRLLAQARERAVFVCSGLDLELKGRITSAGFLPWTGRIEEIHDAFATHRMQYRVNRGQHYFELEDIDRARPDWESRYSTLFYRE